ncbi:hypothetical protein O3P69_016292 [Scylla paramamosain]|uniref:Uncharacterized protein n=1 Tax=Scylla paramamosain TaxID=85552 RepID=A0AAW0SAF1_SCYPA
MAWAVKRRLCAVLAVLALGQHSVLLTRPREEMVPLGPAGDRGAARSVGESGLCDPRLFMTYSRHWGHPVL